MQELPAPTGFYRGKLPMLQLGKVFITTAVFWLWTCCNSVIADTQESIPNEFPNPLEMTTPDPLLPRAVVEQPLSPLERLKLAAALDDLNQQATAELQAGNTVRAFEIWHRELRLRRAVSLLDEVEALGRVGAIAWSENLPLEVQVITRRLQAIQQHLNSQPAADLQLLRSLGQAYQQVRVPKQALEIYEKILALVRQQQDSAAVEATLNTIAEINRSWFNYLQAATTYEELLGLATANSDRISEVTYLRQLAYVYVQAKQYQQAVAVKQKLAELYLNEKQFTELPALRMAIAADYESLGQLEEAFQNYQEAYASAWSLQQYYRAGEALRKLVTLYRSQGQINEALQTIQIVLEADERASNFYGMMNTYDEIGQMYQEIGDYSKALAAFQNGFEFAKQLHYQEKYFAQQIEQVTQRISQGL